MWAWNDLLPPLVIVSDPREGPLPLAQYVFGAQLTTNCTVAFASSPLAMAPLLIVHVIARRRVISGVTRGAME